MRVTSIQARERAQMERSCTVTMPEFAAFHYVVIKKSVFVEQVRNTHR